MRGLGICNAQLEIQSGGAVMGRNAITFSQTRSGGALISTDDLTSCKVLPVVCGGSSAIQTGNTSIAEIAGGIARRPQSATALPKNEPSKPTVRAMGNAIKMQTAPSYANRRKAPAAKINRQVLSLIVSIGSSGCLRLKKNPASAPMAKGVPKIVVAAYCFTISVLKPKTATASSKAEPIAIAAAGRRRPAGSSRFVARGFFALGELGAITSTSIRTKFTNGMKKATVDQGERPASIARRRVRLTPIQINGNAHSASTGSNHLGAPGRASVISE